ncbi:MAG: phosphoglucosamine mutase [Candidatus Izimaplasma sp.]|nr:phosphoglucosamine mutase [Candidatus Izimaplasma bacterium]
MGKYFGTDGIRGEFGKELTLKIAFLVGQSLKETFDLNRLVIGRDTRTSGEVLSDNLIKGARSVGIDCMNAGIVSTPLISHYSDIKGIIGIMITASHNPYYDNGIKVFYKGNKLNSAQEKMIETYIDEEKTTKTTDSGDIYSGEDVLDEYLNLIQQLELYKTPLRIGFDSANGANYLISLGVLRELTDTYSQIGNAPDGKNINQGVGSTHIEAIQKLMSEKDLDIGFSFDGDGDRVLAVNQDGTVFDGDQLLYIIATYLKSLGLLKKDTVVLTKMSNLGIIKAFERQNITVLITDVGDKYVLEELNKHHLSLGGENSGHIILRDYLNTGDGLFVALMIIKILTDQTKTLSDLTSDITLWPQKLTNIKVTDKSIITNSVIQEKISAIKAALKGNGKVLVRASGTEPLIRITISCKKEEDVIRYSTEIADLIKIEMEA